jgi:superfamily I DNA and/or RNA helicase
LQAGHRWVLLGDSSQLRPYRYDDFLKALGNMDDVTNELAELADTGSPLVDATWLTWWESLSNDQQAHFVRREAPTWLATFEYISRRLSSLADYGDRRAGGRLQTQFRMHPDIGDLIRDVFYPGQLANAPECSQITHHVQIAGATALQAQQLRKCAIVWIDCPLGKAPAQRQHLEDGRVPYANAMEQERIASLVGGLQPAASARRDASQSVAVLSPYSRQVRQLDQRLSRVTLRPGFVFKQSHARVRNAPRPLRAHTVDSFQGNEADVVVISMVRNNDLEPPTGLGFIPDPFRLNVLASRAARLLVFVGSWDFFIWQTKDLASERVEKMKKLMEALQGYRDDGRLLFIPASGPRQSIR